MNLDPRIGMWISVIAAVLMFLAGAGATLTDIFNATTAHKIVAGATFLGGLISAVNAVLHAIPSKPGATAEFPLGPKA